MQLVWAENVVRKTNKPVLILTPLAVSPQTVREGEKFGIPCKQTRDGKVHKGINVTNYQRLHYFRPEDFVGVVADESGVIKNYLGETRQAVIDFMRKMKYRLLCSATPSPNDYIELGNSSEALGYMGRMDMLGTFFRNDEKSLHPMWWGSQWRLKKHAEREGFWRWICSWARAIRKPSDLGYDDGLFILPPLNTQQTVVIDKSHLTETGFFRKPAHTMSDQRGERRRTLKERCEKVASLVPKDECYIIWCHLNDEGNLLERLIPDSVQVQGSDTDEWKETAIRWFCGEVCICRLKSKRLRDKLPECGNKNTKIIGAESVQPAPNTKKRSTDNVLGLQKKTENTCEHTTKPTNISGPKGRQSNETTTTRPDEQNTKKITSTEKISNEKSKSGKNKTHGNDLLRVSNDTDSPSSNTKKCSPNKEMHAPFVEGQRRGTREQKDLPSTTVTKREGSEDSFALTATKELESSTTIQTDSIKLQCTCGHMSGKRVLISKPVIFGHGLNLQHCSRMSFFPSHSFEQYYQGVRRCWRFGQKNPVTVDIVTTEGESRVLRNLLRKSEAADRMFSLLVQEMRNELSLTKKNEKPISPEIPSWLTKNSCMKGGDNV